MLGLTAAEVRRRVEAAYAERAARTEIVLDPEAAREFLRRFPRRPGPLADEDNDDDAPRAGRPR